MRPRVLQADDHPALLEACNAANVKTGAQGYIDGLQSEGITDNP